MAIIFIVNLEINRANVEASLMAHSRTLHIPPNSQVRVLSHFPSETFKASFNSQFLSVSPATDQNHNVPPTPYYLKHRQIHQLKSTNEKSRIRTLLLQKISHANFHLSQFHALERKY